jgi:hypothetical protein
MTDRELLEMAAKAAGIALRPIEIKNVLEQGDNSFIGYMTADCEQWPRGWFDPLTNNDDALRLAVRLQIIVVKYDNYANAAPLSHIDIDVIVWSCQEPDPYAATRRAIVLAAAEIGKAMP